MRNIVRMLVLGLLSMVFGLVEFYIPGIEGAGSDFREIPLLIGVLHISSPIYLIGMSFITALGAIKNGAFWSTFIAHTISLIISWYIYSFVRKKKLHISTKVIFWVFYIFIYYLVILIPILVLISPLFGMNQELSYSKYYLHYFLATRFEILSTILITTLYLIQLQIRKELEKHKNKLEFLVKERTEELETANEELKSINEELYEKNKIINDQNSELTAALETLKETQAQLIHAEKMASLGVLAAGVSHEINNPLNYIMGAYVGLERYFEEHNIKDQETDLFLHSIITGVEKASKIVEGLNFLSNDTGHMDEDCNISQIIDNCLLMLENSYLGDINVVKNFKDGDLHIQGNISNLHQAFINILKNSFQAIDGKGTIQIVTEKKDKNVVIQFTDTGAGIKQEYIQKIAEPFFTTKDPGEGAGLGLSITYAIIKKHNGTIEFSSKENKGTVVTITLPLK